MRRDIVWLALAVGFAVATAVAATWLMLEAARDLLTLFTLTGGGHL